MLRPEPMPAAAPWVIRYEYEQPQGARVAFDVPLDPRTLLNTRPPPAVTPDWARLSFHTCPNCPLDPRTSPACPVALHLLEVVEGFRGFYSYQRVSVRVEVAERAYERKDLPLQAALSPLVGLLMATSGCPVLGKLRPQVRFHLPFATQVETAARASSLYLLAQYFVLRSGGEPDWTLEGLAQAYRAISIVNRAFANRLRAAAPTDANVNALIRLDTISQAVPDIVENELEELRFLFDGTSS
jgi:hypothetical protein